MEMYKVLLVDDEPQILRGMEVGIQWENFGFEVIGTAGNGKEAWEMIQNNRPDVLISDIKMPFMDGLELVEIINKNFIKMKIILFIMILIAIFTYLIILGSSKSKTKQEIEYENKEQSKYLKEWEEKRKNGNK